MESAIGRCFGVIADIQYADADDAYDFSGKQKRSYRNSLEIVKKAATVWRENGVEFVAQLGDIIDSRAKEHKGSELECEKVLRELNKSGCKHLVNIIGNHELYNFSRKELDKRLGIRMNGSTWYSYKPWEDVPLRMVILDGYEVSCIEGLTAGKTDEAKEFMLRHNPNDTNTFGIEWSKGLEGINKRFMPFNGKIGDQQMTWLKDTLTQCQSEGESVIVLTHIPIHPSAADNLCLLWNYQEVLDVLNSSGVVAAVFAGHDHDGGYFCDGGVHHLTLSSPLICQGEELAFMTVSVEAGQLLLNWHGTGNVLPQKIEIKISK